jgi:F0F1-type ATP synthase membrane subunit c/vacuolar-type H+-ATPase subunit K
MVGAVVVALGMVGAGAGQAGAAASAMSAISPPSVAPRCRHRSTT